MGNEERNLVMHVKSLTNVFVLYLINYILI